MQKSQPEKNEVRFSLQMYKIFVICGVQQNLN